ncbi:MAG: hypothetical protein ACPH9S_06225 [Candidatus Puniceispirillaceae bacterium]
MNDDQQTAGLDAGQGKLMERVLGTFDGLYDNATSFISDAAANVGTISRDLGKGTVGDVAEDAGNIATSLGETATGVATTVGAAVGDKLDAAVTFARGFLGG